MDNCIEIVGVYKESFRANVYSINHFRMIGLIDVDIKYDYGIERVTLPFYRSSGTNNGKIKGLWYPIVGIKIESGNFTEFSKTVNNILTKTTKWHQAKKGWLAKSLFFYKDKEGDKRIRGFSKGKHHGKLYKMGKLLRYLYENWEFYHMDDLTPQLLNDTVYSTEIYPNNKHSQRDNFDRFIWDVYNN